MPFTRGAMLRPDRRSTPSMPIPVRRGAGPRFMRCWSNGRRRTSARPDLLRRARWRCWTMRGRTRCCARCGNRGCWKRSTGSRAPRSLRSARTGGFAASKAVKGRGEAEIAGDPSCRGKFDRIDRLADGRLAIVDYKTGKPPSPRRCASRIQLQLGLLGADRRKAAGSRAYRRDVRRVRILVAVARRSRRGFGHVDVAGRSEAGKNVASSITADAFTSPLAAGELSHEAAARLADGRRARFTAKLHPRICAIMPTMTS